MPCSASLLLRKVAIETVTNFASSGMVTLVKGQEKNDRRPKFLLTTIVTKTLS